MATRRSTEPATKMVSFRVTPAEHQRLEAQARDAGVKLGEYVRVRALGLDVDPTYVAAAAALSTNLSGVESAIATAKALLSGNGAP